MSVKIQKREEGGFNELRCSKQAITVIAHVYIPTNIIQPAVFVVLDCSTSNNRNIDLNRVKIKAILSKFILGFTSL